MPPGRPNWRGHLKLSLVTCPVRLYAAIERSKERISFNLLHKETHNRIRMRPVDPDLGEVERSDLVKGYQYAKNRYVILDDEDFDKVKIESSHSMVIERFIDEAAVDGIYLDAPYYMVPDGTVAQETFTVIHEAMRRANKSALSRIVLTSREHMVLICVRDKGFRVSTLRTAGEVRDQQEYFGGISDGKPEKEMLDLATKLIEQRTGVFDPSIFVDRYDEALRKLIEAKVRGEKPVVAEEPAEERGKVINLMDALKRSVRDESGKPPAKSRSRKAASKSAGRKKTAGRRG